MITVREVPKGKENSIVEIADALTLSKRFSRILVARGLDTVEKAKEFLSPDAIPFSDPLLTNGMRSAVERITAARDNGETVVVYGDYDADGITATTIAVRSLKIFGIDAIAVIPERENGYGLTEGVLEEVLGEYCPDLIITVDCGISSVKQIAELEDLGVDVIVTDHHELPDELPDCTVVNCKIPDGHTFNGLCGAGVAYKLARALIGDKADVFLDLVAIATIADSMPLCGENRRLVAAGLKLIERGKCSAIVRELIKAGGIKDTVSSTSLAYSIAPRINAAGRMGNARLALQAFLSDDKDEIISLSQKLNEYNVSRQVKCDDLYKSARIKLAEKSPLLKVNVLYDKSWSTGLVGIVAAKLVEETDKPTILFTEQDGLLHGSARSVAGINIYDALKHAKDVIEDFGGHAQAAGVTVKKENLEKFEALIDEYVTENGNIKDLISATEVDEVLTEPFTLEFAEELERLEPCGTGNKKPCFATFVHDAKAVPLKYGSPHLSLRNDYVNLLYFGGETDISRINSPIKKMVVFEPNISTFNGRKSVKGYVRTVETIAENDSATGDALFAVGLDRINYEKVPYKAISESQADEFIAAAIKDVYGTLLVISNYSTFTKFPRLADLPVRVFAPDEKSNVSTVCFGLKGEIPSGYERVVYLDAPLSITAKYSGEIYVNRDVCGFDFSDLSLDRRDLGGIYLAMKKSAKKFASVKEISFVTGEGISPRQIKFAVKVFGELGLIKAENGRFYAVGGEKTELCESPTYSAVAAYIKGDGLCMKKF